MEVLTGLRLRGRILLSVVTAVALTASVHPATSLFRADPAQAITQRAVSINGSVFFVQDTWRYEVLREAARYWNVPYVWNGESLNGVDCSGLVKMAYNIPAKQHKMLGWTKPLATFPHRSIQQINMVRSISRSQLKPGDLVFWYTSGGYHIALYLGNQAYGDRKPKILEAPYQGARVRVATFNGAHRYGTIVNSRGVRMTNIP